MLFIHLCINAKHVPFMTGCIIILIQSTKYMKISFPHMYLCYFKVLVVLMPTSFIRVVVMFASILLWRYKLIVLFKYRTLDYIAKDIHINFQWTPNNYNIGFFFLLKEGADSNVEMPSKERKKEKQKDIGTWSMYSVHLYNKHGICKHSLPFTNQSFLVNTRILAF